MNHSRRKFLQISAITATVLVNNNTLFAQDISKQNHKSTYNSYKNQYNYMQGDVDKHGRFKDYDIWTNDGIVTRENLNSSYLQLSTDKPDFRPRSETTQSQHSIYMYEKDRLLYPLKRVGNRGEGRWERIDWDSATMQIAQNIWSLMVDSDKGAKSILVQVGKALMGESRRASGVRFANQLGAVLKENRGQNEEIKLDELYGEDLIVLWGYNPMESNIPDAHFIQESRYRGAKVITISPEYNQTARCSDLWIPIKKGSDEILTINLIYEILSSDSQKVEATRYNKSDLKEYDSRFTQQLTSISPMVVKKLAKEMLDSKKTKIICGNGYKSQQNIGYLKSLLGIDDKSAQKDIFQFLSDFDGRYRARVDGDFEQEMAIIMASSIYNKKPKEFKAEFLDRVKFIACIDTKMSESAMQADIVLPAQSIYESWDIYKSQNSTDKLLYSKPAVELKNIGASKDEWSIFAKIAQNLEFIANKTENLEFSKPEDDTNYTTSGFHDLSIFYQEYTNRDDLLNPLGDDELAYNLIKKKMDSGVVTADVQSKKVSDMESIPDLKQSKPDFPYSFVFKKSKWSRGVNYSASTTLLRLQRGEPVAVISVMAAKINGIKDGEYIRVFNDKGEFKVMAKVSSSVPFDCVIMQDGWENFMFTQRAGYSEILSQNSENYVNIERVI